MLKLIIDDLEDVLFLGERSVPSVACVIAEERLFFLQKAKQTNHCTNALDIIHNM